MWESIFLPEDNPDLSWLVRGIRDGTVIGCTDGSFDGKKSDRLCSAGWIYITEIFKYILWVLGTKLRLHSPAHDTNSISCAEGITVLCCTLCHVLRVVLL